MRGDLASGPDDTIRPVSGPASSPAAGRGGVELARVGRRTEVVRLWSQSPLRLLSPRSRADAAWIVAGSYGGGLVTGDRLDLSVRCGDGTLVVLGTQATTKVYRARAGAGMECGQVLQASLGDGASLVSWPDPVTCFARSRYRQRQAFELSPTSSLVAVDWLTSGRMARGERWAFDRYTSEITVGVGGDLKLRESLTLDPADGALDAIARTGGFDCLGTAWVLGSAFADVVEGLCERLERQPIDPRRDVLFGLSRVGDADVEGAVGGAVVRFAARSTDAGWRWLRSELTGVLAAVGIDPWSRRG